MKLQDRKAVTMRGKSADELKTELVQLKKELFNLRFQKANGSLTNPVRSRFVKRKIAIVKTVLAEKKAA